MDFQGEQCSSAIVESAKISFPTSEFCSSWKLLLLLATKVRGF